MGDQEVQLPHKLTLNERSCLNVTGVSEVLGVAETVVVLRTGLGLLTVQGRGLQLKTLLPEGGQVRVEGQIWALSYEEPRKGGWLRRLLG